MSDGEDGQGSSTSADPDPDKAPGSMDQQQKTQDIKESISDTASDKVSHRSESVSSDSEKKLMPAATPQEDYTGTPLQNMAKMDAKLVGQTKVEKEDEEGSKDGEVPSSTTDSQHSMQGAPPNVTVSPGIRPNAPGYRRFSPGTSATSSTSQGFVGSPGAHLTPSPRRHSHQGPMEGSPMPAYSPPTSGTGSAHQRFPSSPPQHAATPIVSPPGVQNQNYTSSGIPFVPGNQSQLQGPNGYGHQQEQQQVGYDPYYQQYPSYQQGYEQQQYPGMPYGYPHGNGNQYYNQYPQQQGEYYSNQGEMYYNTYPVPPQPQQEYVENTANTTAPCETNYPPNQEGPYMNGFGGGGGGNNNNGRGGPENGNMEFGSGGGDEFVSTDFTQNNTYFGMS